MPDWAAWELTIEGLGPEDTRIRRISMGAPNASNTTTFKMRKGNSYNLSMRWLNCDGHTDSRAPWYCWQSQIDGLPTSQTYNDYSNARLSGNEIIIGPGWVAENDDGLLTAHIHESTKKLDGSFGGGNVAEGLVATLYVLNDPVVTPDYNRDGSISNTEVERSKQSDSTFAFWVNDDNDSGDTNSSENDLPGSGGNGADSFVNGRGDLLDFTPLLLDVSAIFPTATPAKIRNYVNERITWKLQSSAVNALFTKLTPSTAGSFHQTPANTFGTSLNQSQHEADVVGLTSAYALPTAFASEMKKNSGKGIIAVEGRTVGQSIRLSAYYEDDSKLLVENEFDIRVRNVADFYGFSDIRSAASNSNYTPSTPTIACPMSEDDVMDKDVFFLHGFNVDMNGARAWTSEMYKRLWQSGSNARFWGVTWYGDFNYVSSTFNGLHYQRDVEYALKSGAAFKSLVESVQSTSDKRIVIAHSLGNMVACEALRQGLSTSKYFMFNAAVASESLDGTAQNNGSATTAKYVPTDWQSYPSLSWAANWYKWFNADSSDMRGKMGWPNYFSTVLSSGGGVYNYYSTGDPIFFESSTVPGVTTGLFHWPTLSWTWPFIDFNITAEEGSWQKQETHKGVEPIAGTLSGGWGFYCWYETVAGETISRNYSSTEAVGMIADGSITNHPVFSCSGTALNNRDATWDDVRVSLAKYVPAISSPVGGVSTFDNADRFFNLNSSSYRDGWGRSHNVYGQNWLHSDMKDMAYFFVYPLYDELTQKGAMK